MSPTPPDETSGPRKSYGWLPIVIGVAVGLAVGVGAHSMGGSPWLWFLAPVLGLAAGLLGLRR
jgi:hypothetical protein